MRKRLVGAFCCTALALGCADGTGPGPEDWPEFDLPVCALPYFLSYPATIRARYSSDGEWHVIQRQGDAYRIKAAPRVVLQLDYDIIAAATEELEGLECTPVPSGTVPANGVVRNIEPALTWRITPSTLWGATDNRNRLNFQILLPTGGGDVIMTTLDSLPRRVIVRRQLATAANDTMPPYDMSSSEAKEFTSATATLHGVTTPLGAQKCFQSGALRHRFHGPGISAGATAIRLDALPSSLLMPGDYHALLIKDASGVVDVHCTVAGNIPGLGRLAYFYREAAPVSLSIGPDLSQPSLTYLSGSCFPIRGELPSQTEYPSFVRFTFRAQTAIVRIWMTAGYMGGTPATWRIEVPGPESAFCAEDAFNRLRVLEAVAVKGRLGVAMGAKPNDGETLLSATRTVSLPP